MERKQIALLVDHPENNFSIEICRGAKAAAREKGIALYIFYGGYVTENDREYEYQNNNVYPLASKTDAVVISIASICRSSWGKQDLVDMFSSVPLVTLNDSYDNVSSIAYSPEDGMRDALYYMIHFLHKKNLIMIGGPLSNNGSNRRISVFREVLKENGLLKEKNQIFHAEQMSRAQEELLDTFFEEAKETDAVVCANDELAIATYRIMKKRNLKVGADVAVIGFDDIAEASRMRPPLASIKAPAYMLGYNAVMMAIQQSVDHKVVKREIPSSFVARESLGFCDSAEQRLQHSLNALFQKHAPFDEIWSEVENCLTARNEHVINTPTYSTLHTILAGIYTIDFNVIQDKSVFSPVFQQISELIENEDALNMGRQQISYVLRCFTENLIHHQTYTQQQAKNQADDFCDRLSHTCIRALDHGALQKEQYYRATNRALNIAAKRLMLFTTQNEACRNILETLRDFHVRHGSLFLFDKPLRNVHLKQLKNQEIRYAGKLCDNDIRLYSNRKLSILDIPAAVSESNENVTAVLSIYCQDELYGYLACDLNQISENELEFLRVHIGTAIHTLKLIESIERQSETDPLTYLYNRRGFYRSVYDFLDTVKQNEQAWIIYVDMDRLKTINDEYGHDEGDMAIVKGAGILKESFPINSIIARMGGDEFLVIARLPKDITQQDIEAVIQKKTDEINTRISRQINVSLSCGILPVSSGNTRLLDEVINDADTIMYQNKAEKKQR
ncbi:MAG: diguanylate cyclase domain-containing protein [Bulleidia sp.]